MYYIYANIYLNMLSNVHILRYFIINIRFTFLYYIYIYNMYNIYIYIYIYKFIYIYVYIHIIYISERDKKERIILRFL